MTAAATTRKLRKARTDFEREQEARLAQVQEFADELSEAFLFCREMSHTWQPHGASRHPDGGYERTLLCPRCTTMRVQSLDRFGMVVSSHYRYPDGYLSAGLGHLAGAERGVLRLASMGRRYSFT
jgi:hypothetical protein